jgi:4a-hydroxytetrahydrobiopterin dehydratase
MRMTALAQQQCIKPAQGLTRLADDQLPGLLSQLHEWEHEADTQRIGKTFKFENYYQTIAFVNAIAWIAHGEDHHPDLEVGYNRCAVHFTTHAVDGLSLNDFICAAKIDALQHSFS